MGKKLVSVGGAFTVFSSILLILGFVLISTVEAFSWGSISLGIFRLKAGGFVLHRVGRTNISEVDKYLDIAFGDGSSYDSIGGIACANSALDGFLGMCSPVKTTYYTNIFFLIIGLMSLIADLMAAMYINYWWKSGVARGMRFKSFYKNLAVRLYAGSFLALLFGFVICIYNTKRMLDSLATIVFNNSFTFGGGFFLFTIILVFKVVPFICVMNMKDYEEYDADEDTEDDEFADGGAAKLFMPFPGFGGAPNQLVPQAPGGLNAPLYPPPTGGY